MNSAILYVICSIAISKGVDPYKAAAVAHVESSLNPKAVGSKGEIGLFQLRPEYFGEDKKELKDPVVNTYRAMKHISSMRDRCPHTKSLDGGWVICHNLGVRGAYRIKRPQDQTYYKKFKETYERYKALGLFEGQGKDRCTGRHMDIPNSVNK